MNWSVKVASLLICLSATVKAEVGSVLHPDQEFDFEMTVVWSPAFQGAWDELSRHFGDHKAQAEPPSKLIAALNSFDWDEKSVMPTTGWKAWAAPATSDFIDAVNREAAVMLGEEKGPFGDSPQPPGSVAFMSVLKRDMVFKKKFYRSTTKGLSFHYGENKRRSVEFWGVTGSASAAYGSLVRVLRWEDGNRSKAVEILSEGDDGVILYEPAEPVNFVSACEAVIELKEEWAKRPGGGWGSVHDKSLHEKDNLRIPVLDFEGSKNFLDQLKGALTFDAAMPYRVSLAKQVHGLRLDEKGAVVKVVVDGSIEPFGEPPPKPKMVARDFVFDRPFFVFLWREKAAWPYFGAWTGDSEGMTEFRE